MVEGDQMTIRPTFPAVQGIPRRRMLQGAGLGALALGSPTLLAACGTDSQVQSADSCKSTDKSDEEKEVNFSNWPEYIDIKGQRMPTLEQFETETGIDVRWAPGPRGPVTYRDLWLKQLRVVGDGSQHR